MFDLSLYVLDLIEHLIKAGASAVSITVEDDRLNGILKIAIKDSSPVLGSISNETKKAPLKSHADIVKGVEINGLRDLAEKANGIFRIGKSELGETTVTAIVKINTVKGEIQHDLAVMLSSVVCTNPDLELSFEFRVGRQACYMRISDISNRLPSEKRGGLTVARMVQEKIKAELKAFEQSRIGRSMRASSTEKPTASKS